MGNHKHQLKPISVPLNHHPIPQRRPSDSCAKARTSSETPRASLPNLVNLAESKMVISRREKPCDWLSCWASLKKMYSTINALLVWLYWVNIRWDQVGRHNGHRCPCSMISFSLWMYICDYMRVYIYIQNLKWVYGVKLITTVDKEWIINCR